MNKQGRAFIEFMRAHKKEIISAPLAVRRAELEALGDKFQLPVDIEVRPEIIAGVNCEWLQRKDSVSSKVVMYIHGGAYVFGSLKTSRGSAITLAQLTGAQVLSVDYRLAPEFPYPAALNDVIDVYQALLQQGTPSGMIAFYGESAGGGLILAATLKLRDEGIKCPALLVCSSPWADLTNKSASHNPQLENKDITLSTVDMDNQAYMYAGKDELTHPYISPLFGRFSEFPPLLIYAGTEEIVLSDSIVLAERASKDGVEVILKVIEGMPHCFTSMTGIFEEADQAMKEIAEFIAMNTER